MLVLCALTPAAMLSATPKLLPAPQRFLPGSGTFELCQAHVSVVTDSVSSQSDDLRSAHQLANAIASLCGHSPEVSLQATAEPVIVIHDKAALPPVPGTADSAGPDSREAYRVKIGSARIDITSASSAGIDYGVQTLLQLLRPLGKDNARLQAASIDDWPSEAYRGLMIDTAHGSRPTMAFMHQLLDSMEAWKLNQLFLYAETNLPLNHPTPPWHANGWSSAEIRDLVAYARVRHIDVVPCVELYGHLHDLLSLESQSPVGAMHHGGELNPADSRANQIVDSWVQQLADLFPSPWIHIGFDEPFELDRMDAASRHNISPDRLWSEHLRHCAALASARGKRAMFWADLDEGSFLFNKYPQLANELPAGAVAVPWFYDRRDDYRSFLTLFKQHRVPLMVAPAVSDWDDIFADYQTSFINIRGMISAGRDAGSIGVINTIWSDSALALHRSAWPGIAYGAAVSWQQAPASDRDFFQLYAALEVPGNQAEQLADVYAALTRAETALKHALGAEPAFRTFDMPFDQRYLQRARASRSELIGARLDIEQALNTLQILSGNENRPGELTALIAQARVMDYTAQRALYATEIEDNFQALPPSPAASDLYFQLGGETAARNHSRVDDLIDRAGECREAFREAWLAEALPYRLATAEGRWENEQRFWIRFQEAVWQVRRDFKPGDPRPTLDQLLHQQP